MIVAIAVNGVFMVFRLAAVSRLPLACKGEGHSRPGSGSPKPTERPQTLQADRQTVLLRVSVSLKLAKSLGPPQSP
ncbi:hypothetical protein SRHO_G00160430 [Serrasalmus rhombeus]